MSNLDALIGIFKKQLKRRTNSDINSICELLNNTKFFRDRNIPLVDLTKIAQCLTYHFCAAGNDIIKYNSFGDTFYIIIKGAVGVFVPNKVENEEGKIETIFNHVSTLNSGKSFGELALIDNARRLF